MEAYYAVWQTEILSSRSGLRAIQDHFGGLGLWISGHLALVLEHMVLLRLERDNSLQVLRVPVFVGCRCVQNLSAVFIGHRDKHVSTF